MEAKLATELAKLTVVWTIEKWNDVGNVPSRILRANPHIYGLPEVIVTPPNKVVTVGLTKILDIFSGRFLSGGWSASDSYFASYNAAIGAGDSSVAAAAAQTDLQAASNKTRVAMNPGFPTAAVAGVNTYQAEFGSSVAIWVWRELALFNNTSGGTMFCRTVGSYGTKASGTVWTATATITATSAT